MAGGGFGEKIVFDFDDPMGNSTCVACGECVQACATGALMPATMVDDNNVYKGKPDRTVDSVCPYCGVGCQLTYQIKDDKIVAVTGKNGPANENRLCVKGRFGFDYVHNPQRLIKPMIRKDGVPKVPHEFIDPSNPWTHFREATWEEALDRAAGGLKKIRDRDGSRALAGFGSAKGSNEEAYLFQKLVRTGFGSNNVDHCTRLCHASSVAALLEGFDAWKENVKDFTPEEMAPICGIPADTLREVARTYARAESAIIFWGMGVSQHTHGTDNARCLIALSLITGQIGRPGTGLHPLRGQNNVQGASDAGLIPMFFPDYKSVEDPA